jgi:predicted MFS family arabinose efflux permease
MRDAERTGEVRPGPVVAGTAVIAVSYGLVRYGYGLYLPEFSAELDLSTTTAGGIAAGSFGAYCLSAAAAHVLIGRGHARWALWLAGALTSVGATVVAGSWSTMVFAAGILVAGSGAGAASPALVSVVASSVPAKREPRGQARVNSGTGLGVLIGGVLVAVAGDAWRSSWLGFAVTAVIVTRWVDTKATWSPPHQTPEATPNPDGHLHGLHRALSAALLAGAGSAAVWTFGRDLLITAGEVTPSNAALLWAILGGAGALGAVSGDLVVRLGLRRAWITTATACAAGTALLAYFPSTVPVAALAMILFGGSYVALSGVLIAWGAHQTPGRAGTATATLFIGLTIGQALGAASIGLIADHWTLPTAFYAAAAITITACIATPATRIGSQGAPAARSRS